MDGADRKNRKTDVIIGLVVFCAIIIYAKPKLALIIGVTTVVALGIHFLVRKLAKGQ